MKKVLVVLTAIFGLATAQAQTQVGAGLLIGAYNNMAIEAKANFAVSDVIDVSPSIDYFLVDSAYDVSMFMISADAHYKLGDDDTFQYYPLAGLNYFSITGDGYSYNAGIGLNLGFGATYAISENMKLYGEAKYVRSGFGLSAGILFSL